MAEDTHRGAVKRTDSKHLQPSAVVWNDWNFQYNLSLNLQNILVVCVWGWLSVQTYLGDIVSLIQDYGNKTSIAIK